MKDFIEYLKASGHTVVPKGMGASAWSVTYGDGRSLTVEDTEEEQPEVLVWCLKELERIGLAFHISNLNKGEYLVVGVKQWSSRTTTSGTGETMTAAAIEALCELKEDNG